MTFTVLNAVSLAFAWDIANAAEPAPAVESTTALPSVRVTAKARPVQSSIDKKVYSVAGDVHSASGTAAEVLNTLPSVEVDTDGNVSLRGDSHVLILIDGKSSAQISGSNAGDGLLQYSASNIDRIEVMTNPPAQYRAEGTAGVINIITKKQRQAGTTASSQASVGNHQRKLFNLNTAYNEDNFSASLGVGLRQDTRERIVMSTVQAVSQGVALGPVSAEHLDEHIKRLLPSMKAGLEYRFSDDQSLALDVSVRERNGNRFFDQINRSDQSDGTLTQFSTRQSDGHEWSMSGDHTLRFKHVLGRPEQTLDWSVHRTTDREHERYGYENAYLVIPAPATADHLFLNHDLGSTSLDVDYANAISDKQTIHLGVAHDHSDYAFENAGDAIDPVTGQSVPNTLLTNQFSYRQQVDAIYGSDQFRLGEWEMLAGVRVEDTTTKGAQITTGVLNAQHYHGLYPSMKAEREIASGRTLVLGYSRRVSRPDPEALNPFIDTQDTHNLRAGNANLKPLESQSLEAGMRVETEHRNFDATVYLRRFRNSVTDVLQLVSPDVVLATKTNLPSSRASGLELASDGPMSSVVSYKVGGNLFHSEIDAGALGASGMKSTTGLNLKASLDYRPSRDDTAQVSLSRADKRLTPQGYVDAINLVNIGFRHQLQTQLSFFLTLSDVFNGQRFRRTINTTDLQQTYLRQQPGRSLFLGFSYTLGNEKKSKSAGFDFDQ